MKSFLNELKQSESRLNQAGSIHIILTFRIGFWSLGLGFDLGLGLGLSLEHMTICFNRSVSIEVGVDFGNSPKELQRKFLGSLEKTIQWINPTFEVESGEFWTLKIWLLIKGGSLLVEELRDSKLLKELEECKSFSIKLREWEFRRGCVLQWK